MIIVWDDPKRFANLDKHGLDFADLTLEFFDASLVMAARSPRFRAIGRLDGMLVVVVIFAPLGSDAVSIISMRPASEIERKLFDGWRRKPEGGA